jgi:diguanylate cyclase (GGDEF)-like protein
MLRALEGWSKLSHALLALTLFLLLFVVDVRVGFELSFSIFYLLPTGLGAWFLGRNVGLAFAFVSAIAWFVADFAAGAAYSHPLIPYWNATVRLGFFAITAVMLAALRREARATEQARALALQDPVTRLPGGAAFHEAADRILREARAAGRAVAAVYIDADDMRSCNETFGRPAGDAILHAIAASLRRQLRPGDVAGHLGGDEVAGLLLDRREEEAEAFLEALRADFADKEARFGRPVRASIGLFLSRTAPADLDRLLHAAEQLMFEAKDAGKNRDRVRSAATATGTH